MTTRVWVAGLLLAGGMTVLARAEDEKKPTPAKATSPALAFSGFVHHADMHGEVVSASDSSVTIRVPMAVPSGGGGGRTRRPQMKLGHKDYTFDYHPEGQARQMKLPPKTDADGKKGQYTNKELDALREPLGFPGYSLAKSDVSAGMIVDLYLVRDRSVSQAKATDSDLKIKWLKVTGMSAQPPAAAAPKKK